MRGVTIVEVAPRDGFQSVGPFIPTDEKIRIVRALYAAGLRRIEVTSFVGNAVPQLADAVEVLAAALALPSGRWRPGRGMWRFFSRLPSGII